VGILAFNEDDAKAYFDAGFTFVAVGSDLGAVTRSADALVRRFKG
jgi:4-hydroxy-2-oxoheptanedioate aldolase